MNTAYTTAEPVYCPFCGARLPIASPDLFAAYGATLNIACACGAVVICDTAHTFAHSTPAALRPESVTRLPQPLTTNQIWGAD